MIYLTTPGVYVDEIPSGTFTIASGPSAVPVFVQAIGPSPIEFPAVKMLNWLEFAKHYPDGEPPMNDILAVGVRAYFLNGGGPFYVVRQDALATVVPTLTDATLIVTCGIIGAPVKAAIQQLCQVGRTLFAIIDSSNMQLSDQAEIDAERARYDANAFSAIYYPWLRATWTPNDVPPSAAVAGVYCATDRTRGVWKAPANVTLKGEMTVKYKTSSEVQSEMNTGRAINLIREIPGGGAIVWGARTFYDSVDWRYVPVRRLFNTVEMDISQNLDTLVFEPNAAPTWERARGAIYIYLRSLWQQGGLMGARQEEAYFVQVGEGVTMTPTDIAEGIMRIKVGLAPVRPAEFVVLEFSQILIQQ